MQFKFVYYYRIFLIFRILVNECSLPVKCIVPYSIVNNSYLPAFTLFFLLLGGRICSFSPCIEQSMRVCEALGKCGFIEVQNIEVLQVEDCVRTRNVPVMELDFLKTKVSDPLTTNVSNVPLTNYSILALFFRDGIVAYGDGRKGHENATGKQKVHNLHRPKHDGRTYRVLNYCGVATPFCPVITIPPTDCGPWKLE